MKRYKDLSKQEKNELRISIQNNNTKVASLGLLGFEVKKLAPTKENKERFDNQFNGHPMCGCVGCMELAKIFIDKAPDIQEAIIVESMNELENYQIK